MRLISRASTLTTAFARMIRDSAFLVAGNELKLDMNPVDGLAVTALIADASATTPEVIKPYNDIVRSGH